MADPSTTWTNTTHDWAVAVDRDHLAAIWSDRGTFAPGPGGLRHLVLEVLAYANDEAEALGRQGQAHVTIHPDGSVSVADDGRGTDTRRDADGRVVRKPIMATKDLRFFDLDPAVMLPDGAPRRGISVVAALSQWLTHTNRRQDGAWTQRYECGLPTTDLLPVASQGDTGTTVRFLPDREILTAAELTADTLARDVQSFPWLAVPARGT